MSDDLGSGNGFDGVVVVIVAVGIIVGKVFAEGWWWWWCVGHDGGRGGMVLFVG